MPDKEVYIKVTKGGPYLVYGIPNLSEKIILTDENGVCVKYGNGRIFEIVSDPVALCRCGRSKNAPYCDGSHNGENSGGGSGKQTDFDGTETASFMPVLEGAVKYEGPDLTLADNEILCAFARFCDAHGGIWDSVYVGNEEYDKYTIEEANLCPSGRLTIFDKNGNMIEDKLPLSIAVLEDDGLKISGPIWLRGGIRVESEDGRSYEVRNRQTLCRCGQSSNKPFCDSKHAHIKFKAVYKN